MGISKLLRPTNVSSIQVKVQAFYEKMNRIATFLQNNNAPKDLLITPANVPIEFYIDKAAILRLAYISSLENFDSFGVFFGLEDTDDCTEPATGDCGKVTACFLGVDKDRNILPQHKGDFQTSDGRLVSGVPGEDTWPPPPPPNPPFIVPPANGQPAISNYFMLDSDENALLVYFQ